MSGATAAAVGVEKQRQGPQQQRRSAGVCDELAVAMGKYSGSSCSTGALQPKQAPRRKPPRTHLHAELVKKRRDPAPSPKVAVREALAALSADGGGSPGDTSAVEALLARSGEEPVPEDWQNRYKSRAIDYWDHFYAEKTINFFKDRNYLREEFGELMPEEVSADPRRWVDALEGDSESSAPPPRRPADIDVAAACAGRMVVLEVGCAVGNGVLPMLRANKQLFGLACDLSPVAVRLLQEKEEYRCGRCLAFPSDITRGVGEQPTSEHEAVEAVVPAGSVDFVTLLFVLSAIDPALHRGVIARLRSRLRPGGMVLFRDYGRGDLAQLRFAPGHWLGGDLYVRGDGTLAAFFEAEQLRADFEAAGFEVVECEYRRREIVNRGTGVAMPRVWVQGKFRRRDDAP